MVLQIEPMLAKTVKPEELEVLFTRNDVAGEEKLDGERNLLHIQEDGSAVLTSRRISKTTGKYADKSELVPHLTAKGTWNPEIAGTIFDGELMHPFGFKKTASILRSLPERAIQLQEESGPVVFNVFDVLYVTGKSVMDDKWFQRRKNLEHLFNQTALMRDKMVELTNVFTERKQLVYESIVSQGGEGMILKPFNGVYVPGNRNVWIKAKAELTVDVVVLDFVEADMEYTGKYPETWEYWAYPKDGQWVKCLRSFIPDPRPDGLVPVNTSWWKGYLSAVRYGQFVTERQHREMGSPKIWKMMKKHGVNMVLIEIGQTATGDEDMIKTVTENREFFRWQVMEVKANERFTDTGKLRHPVFMRWRDDKNPEDCVWNGKKTE